jgi:hypothetical protein
VVLGAALVVAVAIVAVWRCGVVDKTYYQWKKSVSTNKITKT